MNSDKKTQQIFKTKQNEPKKKKNLKTVNIEETAQRVARLFHFFFSFFGTMKSSIEEYSTLAISGMHLRTVCMYVL